MARTANTIKRHNKVVAYYDKLRATKENIGGKKVRKFSEEYCLAKTADEHGHEETYVRRIINGWF